MTTADWVWGICIGTIMLGALMFIVFSIYPVKPQQSHDKSKQKHSSPPVEKEDTNATDN